MAMSINTNITSMIGQQNLNESKSALTTSMERLSSGLRINSAKDDAAGQAIANRMSSQITGLSQAQRNANDGISVAQTAEGALNQVNDNLQRVRELAVQAQNGTNSEKDLTSIQDEINQRLSEIDRISGQTDFNGTKVLASDTGLKVQVGANDGEAITVNLKEINAETLGLSGFNVDGAEVDNAKATEADLQAQAGDSIKTSTGSGDYTLTTNNQELSGSQVLGELASGDTVTFAGDSQFGANMTVTSDTYTADGEGGFTYAGSVSTGNSADISTAIVPSEGSISATYQLSSGTIDVNIDSEGTITRAGDGADLYVTSTGELSENDLSGTSATVDNLMAALDTNGTDMSSASLTLEDGTTFTGTTDAGGVDITNAAINAEDLVAAANADGTNAITVTDAQSGFGTDLEIGGENDVTTDGTTQAYQDVSAAAGTFATTTDASFDTELYVGEDGSVTDAADGNGATVYVESDGELTFEATNQDGRTADPLAALDSALNQVDSLRSDLGAVQNRFDSAITNLQTNETNLSAARSRIEDADYATEVADMTKNQILQQAGTSVLAQANQLPQGVLSLLG
jgi:flagellin